VRRTGRSWRESSRTRRALSDAAARLFAERGYEETTIADLAAAVDISPRTFFSYFPAKEDVLFADIDDRIAALSELELRQPGERLLDALRRVAGQVAEWLAGELGDEGSEPRRRMEIVQRIIERRPSLQAAVLVRLRAADRTLASRLHAAYPDEMDEILAAAVVGAFAAGLRAGADVPPGSPPSVGQPNQVIDRVLRLLEHGLGT
jgi:AcrR family transcriptional regulator